MPTERELLAEYAANGYQKDQETETNARRNLQIASETFRYNWYQALNLQRQLVAEGMEEQNLATCAFTREGNHGSFRWKGSISFQELAFRQEKYLAKLAPMKRLELAGAFPISKTRLLYIQPQYSEKQEQFPYQDRSDFKTGMENFLGRNYAVFTSMSFSRHGGIYRVCPQRHFPSEKLLSRFPIQFQDGKLVTQYTIAEIIQPDSNFQTTSGENFDNTASEIAKGNRSESPIISGRTSTHPILLKHFNIPAIPEDPDYFPGV